MSPSDVAFLALGLVLGAAIGAALARVARVWPAPSREVRLTITPNAIPARRAHTLAVPHVVAHQGRIAGSPVDEAPGEHPVGVATTAGAAPAGPPGPAPTRTRVPSAAVALPATAVSIPVGMPGVAVARDGLGAPVATARAPLGSAPQVTAAASHAGVTAVAVLDAPEHAGSRRHPLAIDLDAGFTTLVRPRSPIPAVRPGRAVGAVAVGAVAVMARSGRAEPVAVIRSAAAPVARPALAPASGPTLTRPRASSQPSGADPAGVAGSAGAEADPCAGPRRAVGERCALADVAREQARRAADALKEAQRAYDILRDRVERAQALADPRHVAEAKDRLHADFRAASSGARTPDETEAAARAWLKEINQLNIRVRDALRTGETGRAELVTRLPALERLAAEAHAARIAGENAEAGCREAREELAGCEEAEALARVTGQSTPPEPDPFAGVWPDDNPDLPDDGRLSPAERMAGMSAIVRILRGDRGAREHLVATLGAGDREAEREWQLRVARLVDAIVGRAIEDGYLDLPFDDRFWRLFTHEEVRDIVGALSALGFRYDGLGGFADGRVPAARDLSLAVGYAGLDPMRIRAWPRDAEIALLFERAVVASDEWLADQAGDLTLGRMVDALGGRAADLADVWNAWGRVRPALLEA